MSHWTLFEYLQAQSNGGERLHVEECDFVQSSLQYSRFATRRDYFTQVATGDLIWSSGEAISFFLVEKLIKASPYGRQPC